ncbi:hypothetical protein KIPB_000252 [Kipferlia bialata]|uniref:Helicase-associated domain-containing protein n=1 Tax=Kipferlia bialata TaxID=797122 RepID=A0A9K3GEC8_9EUKA|nr:hypothetical protein KIPB_000252 [Kipferlia bialata]|eukprot:g252.t1
MSGGVGGVRTRGKRRRERSRVRGISVKDEPALFERAESFTLPHTVKAEPVKEEGASQEPVLLERIKVEGVRGIQHSQDVPPHPMSKRRQNASGESDERGPDGYVHWVEKMSRDGLGRGWVRERPKRSCARDRVVHIAHEDMVYPEDGGTTYGESERGPKGRGGDSDDSTYGSDANDESESDSDSEVINRHGVRQSVLLQETEREASSTGQVLDTTHSDSELSYLASESSNVPEYQDVASDTVPASRTAQATTHQSDSESSFHDTNPQPGSDPVSGSDVDSGDSVFGVEPQSEIEAGSGSEEEEESSEAPIPCTRIRGEKGRRKQRRDDRTWKGNFSLLKSFMGVHGRLPLRSETYNGSPIGSWVHTQRTDKRTGHLKRDRIDLLDSINFPWRIYAPLLTWDESFTALERYWTENNKWPLRTDKDQRIRALGRWMETQRRYRKRGDLSQERIDRLDAMCNGFPWVLRDPIPTWDESFEALRELLSSQPTWPPAHSSIGSWVAAQRKKRSLGKLKQDQIDRLDSVGIVWVRDNPWDLNYASLKAYYETHSRFPTLKEDNHLSNYMSDCRQSRKHGKMSQDRIARLDAIAFAWDSKQALWDRRFAEWCAYMKTHTEYPRSSTHVSLYHWAKRQRRSRDSGTLSKSCEARLDSIDFPWLSYPGL